MSKLSDAVGQVLVANGIAKEPQTPEEAEQQLHSWRCGYPETYGQGPCDCFSELVDDIVAAVIKHYNETGGL